MQRPKYRQTTENFRSAAKGKKIIFFGCGSSINSAAQLIGNPEYICDNNDERWETRVLHARIEVVSPFRLYKEDPERTVILVTAGSAYVCSITRQIQEIGDFPIFYWNVLENDFLRDNSTELFDNDDQIRKVGSLLMDDRSRQIFREVVNRRIIGSSLEYADLKTEGEVQYLYPPMYQNKFDKEIILDCGSFIGDTAERFLHYFGDRLTKIYAFEALPGNLEKLQAKRNEFKDLGWKGEMVILPYACSNKEGKIAFCETASPGGSFSPCFRNVTKFKYVQPISTMEVETRSIDQMVPETERITVIKMDIEGAEYEALLGASETIKRCRPRLAISIYHNASDYWRLIFLIKELVPEYFFAVRHHKARHVDTVLYAWLN